MNAPTTKQMTLAVPLLLAGLAACSGEGPTTPAEEATALLGVEPAGGSTGVAVDAVITVEFSHAMNPAMSEYADLHEGDVTGPEVPGSWTWLQNATVLWFAPAAPLAPATDYVIHLGGGMMDVDGHPVEMEEHGEHMGGTWATDAMMTAGMSGGMGGGMGSGTDPSDHMGGNWDHPTNGSHGMIFTFTTAG